MTGRFQEGDRVVFSGARTKLLNPDTFELSDKVLEPGTVGVVRKIAGPFYVINFENVEGGVPVAEDDLKKEGEP